MKKYLSIPIIAILFSCSSLKITNAYKQKNISGLQGMANTMQYVIVVKSESTFTLTNLQLTRKNKVVTIDEYSFTNKETHLGHTVSKTNKEFPKGVYEITFSLGVEEVMFEEILNISFEVNQKKKTQNILLKEKRGIIQK